MLHRQTFRAMGCDMLAVIDSKAKPALLDQVPNWFDEWEQVLSRFRIDSELTRLNQTHETPIEVSDTLWDVFQTARQAEVMTNGLVTPTLLDAIIEAGYDRPFDKLPHLAAPVSDAPHKTSLQLKMIRFDVSTHTITLPMDIGLDFGGSAKGWAAHQAVIRMQFEGPALMDAGGDIAISAPRLDGSPWQIGIADPFHKGEEAQTLFIESGGVATSGKDRHRWTKDNLLQHHIIDPSTNLPAETDLLTVTVVAPTVMQAEAIAKAAFILGSRTGMDWLNTLENIEGVFILENGLMIQSTNMDRYL